MTGMPRVGGDARQQRDAAGDAPSSGLHPQSPLPTVPGLLFPFALQLLPSFSAPDSIRARTPASGVALPGGSTRSVGASPWPNPTRDTAPFHPQGPSRGRRRRRGQAAQAGGGCRCRGERVQVCAPGSVGVTARRARGCPCQLGVTAVGCSGGGWSRGPAHLCAPGRRGSRAALSSWRCRWGWSPPGPRTEPAWRRTRAACPGRASTATCRVSGGSFPFAEGVVVAVPRPLALTVAPLSAAAGACPRLTPPPGSAPDVPLGLAPHGLWSRHILQQTLMDEGLRLARLVSHERVGRLSPCLPGKPPGPGELPRGPGGASAAGRARGGTAASTGIAS